MKQNRLSNFSRGLPREHSCEIGSKSVHRFSRSHLKLFLFQALAAIFYKGAKRFGPFCLRVTEGTFLYNYFKIYALIKEEKSFKGFSIFSSDGHLVERSQTV